MDLIITNSFLIFTLVLIAAISPGPDLLITLKNALSSGRKAGMFTALGIALAIYIHVAYSILGIAVLISQSTFLFSLVKYAGAAYLLWLAYKSFQSKGWDIKAGETQATEQSAKKSFTQGFVTNALNPKATIFFMALFTQFITPDTTLTAQLWYGTICAITAGTWFCIVSICLTHKHIRKMLGKWSIWIDRVTGVAFIGLAARLAVAKIN